MYYIPKITLYDVQVNIKYLLNIRYAFNLEDYLPFYRFVIRMFIFNGN